MGDLNIEQKSGQELTLNFLAQERTVSGRKGGWSREKTATTPNK